MRKVAAIRRLGADVRSVGEDFDAACLAAADLAAASGWQLLIDGADPWNGIAARVPVPKALELMIAVVDEMLLVDEDQIVEATREMSVAVPSKVEPAAGAGWAAVRAAEEHRGVVGVLVTGGNVVPAGSPDGVRSLDAVPEDRAGRLGVVARPRDSLQDQRLDRQAESQEERAADDQQSISCGQLADIASCGRAAEDHQHAGAEATERQDPER